MRSCHQAVFCAAFFLFLSASCSSSETRPVDAKFSVTVEGDGVPDGYAVSVDVLWLGNGSVDIFIDDADGWIHGAQELKGVVIKEGNEVLNEGPVPQGKNAEPYFVRLEGRIDPESLDLRLSITPPGGETAELRLRGEARPLGDAAELDGEYLVLSENNPALCPGDQGSPRTGRNLPIDILSSDGGARLTIDGRFVFKLPVTTGSVDTKAAIYDRWYKNTFEANVSGEIAPDIVDLKLDVPNPSKGDGCVNRLALTGGKRLPDETVIDGDYRAEYVWQDDCRDASGVFTATLRLLDQGESKYDFFDLDSWLQFDMTPGEPFAGDFIDLFGSGAVIRYEGVIDPPNLSYSATYTYPYSEPCDLNLEVTAYKRYFFPPDAE